jgi:hypothetical protein
MCRSKNLRSEMLLWRKTLLNYKLNNALIVYERRLKKKSRERVEERERKSKSEREVEKRYIRGNTRRAVELKPQLGNLERHGGRAKRKTLGAAAPQRAHFRIDGARASAAPNGKRNVRRARLTREAREGMCRNCESSCGRVCPLILYIIMYFRYLCIVLFHYFHYFH